MPIPRIAHKAESIFIVLTDEDIFPRQLGWEFTYGLIPSMNEAIVSTHRMDPGYWGDPPSPAIKLASAKQMLPWALGQGTLHSYDTRLYSDGAARLTYMKIVRDGLFEYLNRISDGIGFSPSVAFESRDDGTELYGSRMTWDSDLPEIDGSKGVLATGTCRIQNASPLSVLPP